MDSLLKNIKAFLFDMDGVVIDSEKLYSQSEEKLLAQYGVNFDDSDWLKIKGCTEKQFYDLIYSKFSLDISREELMLQGRKFLKNIFSEKLQYMDGFNEVYTLIKHKYQLALVTSTGSELADHIDGLLSIYKKFNIVVNSSNTVLHKPNPDPYLFAMNHLGVKPQECIVIEDSIQGIKAGKAAGCFVIAIEGSLQKKFLKESDYIISSFYDLKKVLIN
ncbi:MAG: hypothetical protein CMG66_02180 [Candidatus Marinimicrobia bacterium]|nr:hypothetical protein [Candidatus Neomarinimicrobiota bacterium]|tara:strand:+ start:84910 stop:85563 length:654 start_codon:yes stop_codon:yes gene_type:complete